MAGPGGKHKRRLLEILGALPDEQRDTLLEFAEFLFDRYGGAVDFQDPLPIGRPQDETVVFAIRRLRATYPMLDPGKMLQETADLMTQHVVHGRDKKEVIDELEILFRRHYDRLHQGPDG